MPVNPWGSTGILFQILGFPRNGGLGFNDRRDLWGDLLERLVHRTFHIHFLGRADRNREVSVTLSGTKIIPPILLVNLQQIANGFSTLHSSLYSEVRDHKIEESADFAHLNWSKFPGTVKFGMVVFAGGTKTVRSSKYSPLETRLPILRARALHLARKTLDKAPIPRNIALRWAGPTASYYDTRRRSRPVSSS